MKSLGQNLLRPCRAIVKLNNTMTTQSEMRPRFSSANKVQNGMVETPAQEPRSAMNGTVFVKRFPAFFKRNDIKTDFVAAQRELESFLPPNTVKVLNENLDSRIAKVRFENLTSETQQQALETILARRGYVKLAEATNVG